MCLDKLKLSQLSLAYREARTENENMEEYSESLQQVLSDQEELISQLNQQNQQESQYTEEVLEIKNREIRNNIQKMEVTPCWPTCITLASTPTLLSLACSQLLHRLVRPILAGT